MRGNNGATVVTQAWWRTGSLLASHDAVVVTSGAWIGRHVAAACARGFQLQTIANLAAERMRGPVGIEDGRRGLRLRRSIPWSEDRRACLGPSSMGCKERMRARRISRRSSRCDRSVLWAPECAAEDVQTVSTRACPTMISRSVAWRRACSTRGLQRPRLQERRLGGRVRPRS